MSQPVPEMAAYHDIIHDPNLHSDIIHACYGALKFHQYSIFERCLTAIPAHSCANWCKMLLSMVNYGAPSYIINITIDRIIELSPPQVSDDIITNVLAHINRSPIAQSFRMKPTFIKHLQLLSRAILTQSARTIAIQSAQQHYDTQVLQVLTSEINGIYPEQTGVLSRPPDGQPSRRTILGNDFYNYATHGNIEKIETLLMNRRKWFEDLITFAFEANDHEYWQLLASIPDPTNIDWVSIISRIVICAPLFAQICAQFIVSTYNEESAQQIMQCIALDAVMNHPDEITITYIPHMARAIYGASQYIPPVIFSVFSAHPLTLESLQNICS